MVSTKGWIAIGAFVAVVITTIIVVIIHCPNNSNISATPSPSLTSITTISNTTTSSSNTSSGGTTGSTTTVCNSLNDLPLVTTYAGYLDMLNTSPHLLSQCEWALVMDDAAKEGYSQVSYQQYKDAWYAAPLPTPSAGTIASLTPQIPSVPQIPAIPPIQPISPITT